jgi:hypothetical protein
VSSDGHPAPICVDSEFSSDSLKAVVNVLFDDPHQLSDVLCLSEKRNWILQL